MDNKFLTFHKINIIRAPGFSPPGFSVEGLKPQINIIYGPNAAGKTTIARALSYLIWPDKMLDRSYSLQGEFTLDKSNWFVDIDVGKVVYQRDGSNVLRPAFPTSEQRDRYFIALHELLQKETGDSSLAEIIIKETAGGYQILEAVEELGFKDTPFRKGRVSRDASNKLKEYQEAIKKQEALIDEERKLEQLHEKLVEIQKAEKQLEIVKQAIEYKKVNKEYKEIQSEFDKLPATLANIKGDEEEQLEKIKENIKSYTDKKMNAGDKYSKAKKVMESIALTGKGVQESFITEVKNKKERLKSWEEKLEQLQGELNAEESRRNHEQKSFINLTNEKKLTELDSTTYNKFSDFARRAEQVHNEILSLESLKDLLRPEEKLSVKENIIEKGIHYLQEWLREPEGDLTESKKLRDISLVSSIVILIMSIYMGYVINPLLFVLLIIPVSIFWYGAGQQRINHDYRKDARERFEQLMFTSPDKWEPVAVKERLNELYDLAAEIKLLKRRKQYWEDRSKEYAEMKKKQEEINQERTKLINQYGVAPDTGEQTLYYLTNRLSRWQDAHSRVLLLNKKIEQYKNSYKELRDNINEMLKNYGYYPAANAEKISGNITDLEERNNKFKEAVRIKREAESVEKEAEKKLKENRENEKEIYNNLGLKLNDREKLRRLCDKFSDYINLKDTLSKIAHLRKKERMKLAGYTDSYQEILAKSQLKLKKEMKELKNRADEYKNTLDIMSKIEAKIDTAKGGRSVEEAIAFRDRSLDKLRKEYDNDCNKLTGKVIADHIRNKHTVENRPEVFNKAREIFTTISRGNYKLVIDESQFPVFRAIETDTGRGKSLEQLSSGTRIQLLIAVRMAFIDSREQELALPLYLDETLANADDSKAEAIIKTIIELARNGRQCFYFTAQRDEVNKWLTVLTDEPDIEFNFIDLAKSKKDNKSISLPNINNVLPDVGQFPTADGISHKQYGRKLSVPGFNPRKGAESTHLWYIIEDTELISHFLNLGITKWGQLKTMLETGKVTFIPEDKSKLLKDIKKLGCCLEEYVNCWKVGRGKLVDRSVLLKSNAVSENFIDEVTELAGKVDGDAKSIIKELRSGTVARFLGKKIDDLEQYFEEENYINSVDILSGEQIYARMLSVVNMDNFKETGNKVKRLFKRLK